MIITAAAAAVTRYHRADTTGSRPPANPLRTIRRTAGKLSIAVLACLAVSAAARPVQEPLWLEGTMVTPQAEHLLDELKAAEVYGLDSSDYQLRLAPEELAAVLANRATTLARQRFTTALSQAAAHFVADLHRGRIDAHQAGFDLPAASPELDLSSKLASLASSRDIRATLAALEPAAPPYQRLKTALAEYRELARQPALSELPALPARSIFLGDDYAGAPKLRHLLAAVGDLPRAGASASDQYDSATVDAALVAAIERFQQRHGLGIDGVVGPQTFAALTTPLSRRVLQIELAMERWRWLSTVERPSIVVNIPQFMLFGVSHDATAPPLEMRVIVGKTYPRMRTPVFQSRITQVVFQPYWDVPRSILLHELLPRIRANRSLLDRYHMEIVAGQSDGARIVPASAAALAGLASGTLRLRQRPGPDNALGPVKFAMPNPYNVYLHGTPEQELFERSTRTFSHGCIRVSDPAALAAYVLRSAPDAWDDNAIQAALSGTSMRRVKLERPVPVVVFYTTAVVTRSTGVLFFDDVYGHDAKLRQLLEQASS